MLALRSYLWRYKAMLAAAGVALVVSAMAMLAVPLALRRIIDYGFKGSDGVFIDRYFMMLIVIGVVLAAASAARFFLVNWIGERVVADLRSDIFQHLSRLGPSFFERTHSAEVMSRLTADTTQIKSAAGSAISQLLRNLVMLVGSLVMMLVTSFKLSLVLLVAIPLIVLPLMAYGRVVRKLSRSAQDKLAEASSYAAENLAAVRTMQAYTHEAVVSERFRAAVERSFEAARSRNWARAFLTAVTIFLVFASIAGVLWIGATAVVSGSMSGGRLGQFVVYAAFAAGALAELSEVYGEVQQAAGAAERLGELLAERPAIEAPADPVPLPGSDPGAVAFVGVSFSYPSRPEIAALHNVSLAIRPGEQVAIVGPSGAGKSTLFALLQRFYDCDAGKVTVDGVDVRRTDPLALRRRLAYVPQEVALFADTVVENIRYGAPGASLDDVKRAAEAAQAHEFIVRLPNGYDTRLGERGATLSGGQRQRIAIARAILRDAPVLLLDEATSALDAESETLVQKALERVMSGRTTLVIAHRLATVQKADRIVVMDGGRIVEEGTHSSLVARGGLYARLADLQLTGERVA
ncbi:MAG: ABC transporter transmembrane domain-containing protein [Hyphomicrobiaceae bacterium]